MAIEKYANDATTTLNGAITSGATTITVTSATKFPTTAQYRILVEGNLTAGGTGQEYMIVTAGAGTNTWTVTRAAEAPYNVALGFATAATVVQALTVGALLNQNGNDVRSFGVKGDGVTNDAVALQNAMNAVGAQGGVLFFPPEMDILINSGTGLVPASNLKMIGSHAPRYEKSDNGTSPCKIRIGSGFAGTGLFKPTGTTRGWSISGIALYGAGLNNAGAAPVHGIQFPDLGAVVGEQGVFLEKMTIAGFTGSGIYGRIHVMSIQDVHINRCRQWAYQPGTGNRMDDTFWDGCFLYYNNLGGIWLGESSNAEKSGYNYFTNCRFERSGCDSTDVVTPLVVGSPGIKITAGWKNLFTNCNTDRNTGNGLQLEPATTNMSSDNLLNQFVNCQFSGDGQGNNVALSDYAGIKVKGLSPSGTSGVLDAFFSNCSIVTGKPDDTGLTGIDCPKYGLWLEHTEHGSFKEGRLQGVTAPIYYGAGGVGSVYRWDINDYRYGLMTIPITSAGGPPQGIIDGCMWIEGTTLKVRIAGVTRTVTVT